MKNGVTIGVPVCNEQDRIERTIRRAAPQCEKLIVADNCSTDDTEKVCRRLLSEYPNMSYFRHSRNLGALRNAFFLIEKTNTPFYMMLGSHDYIDEGYVEKLHETLEENTDIELATGELWFDYGTHIEPSSSYNNWTRGLHEDALERTWSVLFDRAYFAWAGYGLFRTETYRKLLTEDLPPYGADVVFLARVAKAGKIAIVKGTRYYGWIRKEEDENIGYVERLLAEEHKSADTSRMRNELRLAEFELISSFFPSVGFWKKATLRCQAMTHFGTFKKPGLDVPFYLLYLPVKIWRRARRLTEALR